MEFSTYLRAIFGLARPIILLGVLLVHGGGVAAAFASGYPLNGPALLLGFVALLFAGASVNFVNEYADYETDSLTEKTRYSGGSGVLPAGLVPRRTALAAGWVTLLLGLGIAVFGAVVGVLTWTAVAVLVAGAFGGWMYSLPPLKLAWNGAAEIANGVLGGLVLPLYGYSLLSGRVEGWVIAAFLPYALLITTTAMATTWPDRDADRQVGKRTLATWMPVSRLRLVYLFLTAASFVVLLVLPFVSRVPVHIALVGLLVALPPAVIAYQHYTRVRNPHATARAAMMLLFAQTAAWFYLGLTG